MFVKDLSELSDDRQSDDVLDLLERSVLGSENDQFIVVAANHGQILERLRVLGQRQGRPHSLRKPIQDAFLLGSSTPERLAIFEPSHTARRQSLEEVLSAVAEHPEWENCAKSHLKSEERLCPIFENKERLRGKGDGKRFAKRLGDLVELARNNGWHLPVRDLLALVANMVLGHRDAKEGLLSCSEVANIQDTGKVENGSVYDNVFGANLPRRRASDRQVFQPCTPSGLAKRPRTKQMACWSTRRMTPKLACAFERLVKSDPIYGATASYLAAQSRYLDGDEEAQTRKRRGRISRANEDTAPPLVLHVAGKRTGLSVLGYDCVPVRGRLPANVRGIGWAQAGR